MKFSTIKEIKIFCSNLVSDPDWREVVENISQELEDFEINDVRFIKENCIDEIQQGELSSDLYCLGCFNAPFLSEILEIDCDAIEAMQEAEAFEAVGKLIISLGKLEEVQAGYASADGYGHHFNHYDFGEESLLNYLVFDNQ